MSPRRLRLEGSSLEPLLRGVRARYGADVRVVSVERVSVGGLFGFGARRHYEVVVETGEPGAPSRPGDVTGMTSGAVRGPGSAQRPAADSAQGPAQGSAQGLSRLIAAAEAAEREEPHRRDSWHPSTQSSEFADLLDSLTRQEHLVHDEGLVVLNPEAFASRTPPSEGGQGADPSDRDEQADGEG